MQPCRYSYTQTHRCTANTALAPVKPSEMQVALHYRGLTQWMRAAAAAAAAGGGRRRR